MRRNDLSVSIGALLAVCLLGLVLFSPGYSPPEYPEKPESTDETSAVSYATAYERAFASEQLVRGDEIGDVEDIQFRFGNTNLTTTDEGYRVRFSDVHRTVHNGGSHVDRWYKLTYFVNESKVLRKVENQSWETME